MRDGLEVVAQLLTLITPQEGKLEGVTFNAIPWLLKYDEERGEFILRQRKGTRASKGNWLKAAAEKGCAPATLAHNSGIESGYGRPVVRYVNGKRVVYLAVPIDRYRRDLSEAMKKVAKIVASSPRASAAGSPAARRRTERGTSRPRRAHT
jgi:hypothetical protein